MILREARKFWAKVKDVDGGWLVLAYLVYVLILVLATAP